MASNIINLNTTVIASASVVGDTEHKGPLGGYFDIYDPDDLFGEDTWEKAESEMQRRAFGLALKKTGLRESDIDAVFAGDLLNQCVASAYGLLDFDVPYLGLYGACSTAAEGLILSSLMTSSGLCRAVSTVTSSHYCSAERQYRTPLEYGAQRSPTAQRTVTGSGAFIVGEGGKVRVTGGVIGIVVEKGVSDAANMGAAMAPAALSTLVRYFSDSGEDPKDIDLIVTGDLGYEGGEILVSLARAEGIDLGKTYNDCGMMIYSRNAQDVHAGGSGCGCSAVVLASYILPKMERGEIRKTLFLGTGAMMSPTSVQQGCAIPAVAHLVRLEV